MRLDACRRLGALAVLVLLAGCDSGRSTPEPTRSAAPTAVLYSDGTTAVPEGPTRNRVMAELATTLKQPPATVAAGHRVITTLDRQLQQTVADAAALNGEPETLQAAVVVIEPGTGSVLAYYGGENKELEPGRVIDYAASPHPSGASFAAYDLAAALQHNVSPQSRWESPPKKTYPGQESPIVSDGRCPNNADTCTLAEAVNGGVLVPLYTLTRKLGPRTVLATAHAVGIDGMQGIVPGYGEPRTIDLRTSKIDDVVPKYFDSALGIGQYPISVVDHTTGMATFAAGGRRTATHLIASVDNRPESAKVADSGLTKAQADQLTWTLSRRAVGEVHGHRTAAITGTWRLDNRAADVYAHAWITGYTDRVAVAVWIGNKADERPLKDRAGRQIVGSTLPAQIYQTVLDAAMAGKTWTQHTQPPPYGDVDAGDAQ
jgi:membrane peptidoglycan carboxypeptidase